jgi:putative flippase GtrA
VAAFVTFALHARFTFKVKVSGTAIGLYAGVVSLGLAVATAIFSLFVALDASVLFAKLAATASAIALQFVLNRAVVFRSSKHTGI